jgi:hypothetical protein
VNENKTIKSIPGDEKARQSPKGDRLWTNIPFTDGKKLRDKVVLFFQPGLTEAVEDEVRRRICFSLRL